MASERDIDDDRQRNANTRTRPIRVAFLVELSEASQTILTAIFQACFRFWGGRFSLVIPCKNGVPLTGFRAWLRAYDPDVIYSYVDLSDAEQVKLHEDVYPAYLVRHRDPRNDERADIRVWSPALPITPLGISTLLPLLARRSAFGPPTSLKMAIALGQAQASPFLLDSFGTHVVHGGLSYSRLCEHGPSPARRLAVEARRICHVVVRPPIYHGVEHATYHRVEDPHVWWFAPMKPGSGARRISIVCVASELQRKRGSAGCSRSSRKG
jgi:hypothetical protein